MALGTATEGVVIKDVGPRDGLQSQSRLLSPGERVRLVQSLLAAGIRHVEVGAFVSQRAVPAMAGSDEVLAGLMPPGDARLDVLVPNVRGYELARAAGAENINIVIYGSDGMANANVRMSREQAEVQALAIIARARSEGVHVTTTIAVAFECPYDGAVDRGLIQDIATRFLEAGSDEFCIADTIGAADPAKVRALTRALVDRHASDRLSCHFHDTRAMGLANVFAALESGIRKFDASIAGLGGCPFAPGASGNVATEDVVMMVEQIGFDTGIDLARLLAAVDLAQGLTGTAPGGRSAAWLRRRFGKATC